MPKKKILIVEDEAITSEAIAEQLEDLGFSVTDTVGTGILALASIIKNPPDLVLMDIILKKGDIDGITAANHIRERFNIPVVYLTAHSDPATINRAKFTYPYGYIVKPFTKQDLQISIEMALQKHEMEQQLAEHKEMLSSILESTKDGILATNETGKIAYMNSAAERLTGWSLIEANNKNIGEIVKIIDIMNENYKENPAEIVIKNKEVIYLDDNIVLVNKNGQKIPVANSVSPIIEENGQVTGVVMLIWDKSANQHIQNLENEVAKHQETEAEIRQVLQAEKEISEFRSRIISTISHEFRTPLMVILSSAGLLQRYGTKWLDDKKNKYFNQIESAVKQMTRLIEDVVTYSKTETGELIFQPSTINVELSCRKIIEEYQAENTGNYILNFSYQTSRNIANLDAELLHRILTNLISNAVKYSPDGGIISLEAACEIDRFIFSVKDQGIGIPPNEMNRLFESFFRGSNVGTIGGTGMGLAIVKKCVEIHSGTITVNSQLGVGTTFTLTLPIQT